MNVLLVCPEYPDTFWSFKHALRFLSKGAGQPPLGLLTVAALLPAGWRKRLVDLNVRPLTPEDLAWADYVFLGGMAIQADSARKVIARCNQAGVPVVAGGPLFTARHHEFTGVDHFVLNEAELTLPPFLEDLRHGRPKPLYTTAGMGGPGHHAHADVGARRSAGLRHPEHPVLARLPLRLRVLRHHRPLRPRAAHQVGRPGDRRDGGRPPDRLAGPPVLRRRQLHREPGQAEEGGPPPDHPVDGGARASRSRWGRRPPSTSPTTRNCWR